MWMLPGTSLVALCSRTADTPSRSIRQIAGLESRTGEPFKTSEIGSSSDRTSATTAEVGWGDADTKEIQKCMPLSMEEKRKQISKQLRIINDLRNDCDMITADAKWFMANLEKMHDECYDPASFIDHVFFDQMLSDLRMRSLIMRTSEISKPPLVQLIEWRNNYRDARATQMFSERDEIDDEEAKVRVHICRQEQTKRHGMASTDEMTIGPE